MNNNKRTLGLIAASVGIALTASEVLANDTFSTAPGTRANGMAGAYVAVARDATSIWYNPAGMTNISGNSVIIEAGQLVGQDYNAFEETCVRRFIESDAVCDWTQLTTEDTELVKYAGYAKGTEDYGYGLAFFKPYSGLREGSGTLGLGIVNTPNGDIETVTGEISTLYQVDVSQVSAAFATKVLGDKLSIGVNLDSISTEINGLSGAVAGTSVDDSSIGYGFGLLYNQPVGEEGSAFSAGLSFKDNNGGDIEIGNNVFGSPSPRILSFGVAFDYAISQQSFLLISTSFDNVTFDQSSTQTYVSCNDSALADPALRITELRDPDTNVPYANANAFCQDTWGDELFIQSQTLDLDYDRRAIGLEYTYLTTSGNAWYIRAGYATVESQPEDNVRLLNQTESESTTFGVGASYGNFNIDLAVEYRDIEFDRQSSILNGTTHPTTEHTLISGAIEFVF